MLKKLRSRPLVNEVVRNVILRAASGALQATDWLTSRWRVAGQIELEIAGQRLLMYAEADDAIVNRLFYRQAWEGGELLAWSLLASRSGAVLDIGANTGIYSVLSSKLQPKAKIYSFEPHPRNYARLGANKALNGLQNVETIQKAVGDRSGMVEFTIPADEEISLVSSAVRSFTESHRGQFKQHRVQQTTIDEFVESRALPAVDIIKIDVESYELAVLHGARRTLETHSPVLMCEVFDYEVFAHKRPSLAGQVSSSQSLEVQDLLAGHGYHFYYVGLDGLLRVSDLHSNPDGGSNYVFSRVRSEQRFLPWSQPELIGRLMDTSDAG